MAARGRVFLKRLVRIVFILLFGVLVVGTFMSAIPQTVSGIPNIPGLSGSNVSATPSADQVTMTKAVTTAAGKALMSQGYSAKAVIDDQGLAKWLDELEQHDSVSNPGPYVLFGKATRQASGPDLSVPPDIVVDVSQQVESAVYQAYSDKRGTACYNGGDVKDISTIQREWVPINQRLWHKSLDSSYDITHDDLPQLPAAVKTVHCYTFTP